MFTLRSYNGGMVAPYLIRTYRYDLLPTRSQERALARVLEAERLLYNAALQEWIEAYLWATRMASILGLARYERAAVEAIDPDSLDPLRIDVRERLLAWRSPDWFSQENSLTLKAQRATLGEVVLDVPANRRRWTLERVHAAIGGFYDRVKKAETPGFPRFRSMRRWRSFGFSEMSGVRFDAVSEPGHGKRGRGLLKLKGMDRPVAVRMHRPLPDGAEIRSCSLTRGPKGWSVSLALRIPAQVGVETLEALADATPDQVMGVDLGIAALAATDDGTILDRLDPERKTHGRVRRKRREVARSKRGSRSRKKKVAALGRETRRVADERKTRQRQEAAKLVDLAVSRNVRAIAFEDLWLRNMTRSARGSVERPGKNIRQKAGLNRSLLDAGLNQFLGHVRSRAESAGIRVVLVNPRGTSIRCSGCGTNVPKALSVRTHRCSCGLALDRDVNAARNIARLGWEALAA